MRHWCNLECIVPSACYCAGWVSQHNRLWKQVYIVHSMRARGTQWTCRPRACTLIMYSVDACTKLQEQKQAVCNYLWKLQLQKKNELIRDFCAYLKEFNDSHSLLRYIKTAICNDNVKIKTVCMLRARCSSLLLWVKRRWNHNSPTHIDKYLILLTSQDCYSWLYSFKLEI